jgi:hypothetical protein
VFKGNNVAELITIAEARESSALSHEQIAQLARNGRIVARKSRNVWLVDLESLKAYEQKMKELGTAKHNPRSKGERK